MARVTGFFFTGRSIVRRFPLTLTILGVTVWTAAAQQVPPPSTGDAGASSSSGAPAVKDPKDSKDATGGAARAATAKPKGTSKDRLFYTLPNFLTVQKAGTVPPLSASQKFKVVAKSSFDSAELLWYGALAGFSQAANSEAGYGQGAEGYAKRFGARVADGTIENFMTHAILPAALHQDPRYYQLGEGSFGHRLGYALSRLVVTRSDSGQKQFNYSEVFGSAAGAGISTYSYHPDSDKRLSNAMSVWGSQIGYDALTLVLKEFWPDIRRTIHKPANHP